MRTFLFLIALTGLIFTCNNPNNANQEGEAMEDTTMDNTMGETSGDSEGQWDQDQTNEFIQEAASSGMMEVELGRLASERGSSQAVKDFGQMMVQDHSTANQQLQEIVQNMQMIMPGSLMEKHRGQVDELQGLSGAGFDQRYIDMMVEAHRQDIDKFQDALNRTANSQLNGWIQNTLPVLQQHYDRVQELDQNQN